MKMLRTDKAKICLAICEDGVTLTDEEEEGEEEEEEEKDGGKSGEEGHVKPEINDEGNFSADGLPGLPFLPFLPGLPYFQKGDLSSCNRTILDKTPESISTSKLREDLQFRMRVQERKQIFKHNWNIYFRSCTLIRN